MSDRRSAVRDYRYDHVHLRSPDPDATARFSDRRNALDPTT
jgi:hypothetical protein